MQSFGYRQQGYLPRVQSDIEIILGRMLKNRTVHNVNKEIAQDMAKSFRDWNISL